jgi:hypothetical protein
MLYVKNLVMLPSLITKGVTFQSGHLSEGSIDVNWPVLNIITHSLLVQWYLSPGTLVFVMQ